LAFPPLAARAPAPDNPAMTIEILLYDGFDELDVFGPFEVLTGAGLDTRLVTAEPREQVVSSGGARVLPDGVLGDPELVLVPGGGWNTRGEQGAWAEAQRGVIGAALARREGRIAAVCTGAMLLAGAGLLNGRPAITHHSAIDDLRAAGTDVRAGERVVDDGDIITAGGVTSGIDLALHLVAGEQGVAAAQERAAEIEYAWVPLSHR
jgi:transcriptional regulator GlxA family with amidase domain